MKIVVTVKQVPDPNSTMVLTPDHRVSRDGEVALDPGDEYGVEVGLRLKEAHGGEVVLISMGPERARDAVRKGLSMGADRGIVISDPGLAGADALTTARALAAAIGPEASDLVICAPESYDGSSGMVPLMLAELLGVPQLTLAKQVEFDGDELTVQRQVADGHQVLKSRLPALITVTTGIAEPRYASLKGIMAARSKEIKVVAMADLGLEAMAQVEVVEGMADAPGRAAGEIVEDDGESGAARILAALKAAGIV